MLKHKKKIGLFTLLFFVLISCISGAVLAAKEPVSKGSVAKPTMNKVGNATVPEEEGSITLGTYSMLELGKPSVDYDWNSPSGLYGYLWEGYWEALVIRNDTNVFSRDEDGKFPDGISYSWSYETIEGTGDIIKIYDKKPCNIDVYFDSTRFFKPASVGKVKVTVTVTGTVEGVEYTFSDDIVLTVHDDRTITIDPDSMKMKKRRTGTVNATVTEPPAPEYPYEPTCYISSSLKNKILSSFGPTGSARANNGTYMTNDISEGFIPWTVSDDVIWSTEQTDLVDYGTSGDDNETCNLVSKSKTGTATFIAALDSGNNDSCNVRIVGSTVVVEEEEQEPEPAQLPAPPAPPALETLDVTITVGSNLGIVNGEQVTLANKTLLIGEDRAMVDYADMAKLIPGLQVAWDWQTLSVTFSKDGKELKMVLDQVPADFDVPFMNIGGRLVVPVRYVGSFFGATVDWVGNTLVVHMYK